MSTHPLVHVVVVDHDGGDLTLACLRSLVTGDWPRDRLRVVLVDNGSQAPVTDRVAAELPGVRVVTSRGNLGFAGGVNLGLRDRDDADYVAIVNNDATVTPGWLGPLVATLAADASIGAACPKILLASPAVEIALTSPAHRRGWGDRRDLGVRVSGARVGDTEVWDRVQLVAGFWGYEPMPPGEDRGQWSAPQALLRVPVLDGRPGTSIALRLAADHPVTAIATSGSCTTNLAVGTQPGWFDIRSDAAPVEVINNVGTIIDPDGYARDRGWLEVDHGQYDEPADVDAWCGAAALLRREYLDDVGPLDERLFLYYEDVEHALRGARRGWRYRSAPTSIVRHVHSATSVERSPLAFHYNERNRLLVHTARAPVADALRAYARHLMVTGSYAMRDVVSPLLHRRHPRCEVVGRRLRALGAAAISAPAMRRGRWPTATPRTRH